MKRELLNNARQCVVLCDSSKFERSTFASVASLTYVDILVTDEEAPTEFVGALRERGIEVIIADV